MADLTPYVAEGELLDDDAWRLIYWRYFCRRESGHPTLEAALSAAVWIEECGSGSTDHIIRPDGSTLEGEEFEAALHRAWGEV